MSLRVAVAAPFRRHGDSEMGKNSFVVDLSLKRDWLTPDQATRLVDVAASAGLLEVEGDTLQATFDAQSVDIPDGFRPTEELLVQPTAFEADTQRDHRDGHSETESRRRDQSAPDKPRRDRRDGRDRLCETERRRRRWPHRAGLGRSLMVVERVRDGRRIAQLFAGEIRGHTRDPLARLSIVDVEDVEGCSGGAFAFGIDETAVARTDGSARSARLADVYVHGDSG